MLLLLFNQYFLGVGTSTQPSQTASAVAESTGGVEGLGGGIPWEFLNQRHWSAPKPGKRLVFEPEEVPQVQIVASGRSAQAAQSASGQASITLVAEKASSRQKKQSARAALCNVAFVANGRSCQ